MKAILRIVAAFSIATWGSAAVPFGLSAHAADCNSNAAAGIDWRDCRKRNLILEGSDLSSAQLSEADFSSTDLRGTNLKSADFTKAALARAMLDNSTAQNSIFEKALGYRTSFVGADLSGASFAKSEMHRANFENAILLDVDFDKSELGRVNFSGAAIDNTHFRFSNLARADFRTAIFSTPIDFTGSYLYLTRFEGVDLTKAVGMTQWQVDMICGDNDTLLPEGLSPNEAWPCGEEE